MALVQPHSCSCAERRPSVCLRLCTREVVFFFLPGSGQTTRTAEEETEGKNVAYKTATNWSGDRRSALWRRGSKRSGKATPAGPLVSGLKNIYVLHWASGGLATEGGGKRKFAPENRA